MEYLQKKSKVEKLLQSVKLPKTLKQVIRLIGFIKYFQKFIPFLALITNVFFNLLRKESSFHITNEHEKNLEILEIWKAHLVKACRLLLDLNKPHCQFFIVCESSFYAKGFLLLIEEPHDAPIAFGSHYSHQRS